MSVLRYFHPVGQGAFYSEIHGDDKFIMVYDCGAGKGQNSSASTQKIIKSAFKDKSAIDVLFISHFDNDHVNGIETLKNTFYIKRVVLPLLHNEEKVLLSNIYQGIGYSRSSTIVSLIENPADYFGNKTETILVSFAEGDQPLDGEPIGLENLQGQISSGTPIQCRHNWVFVPYNYKYDSRRTELENEFKSKNLNIVDMDKIDYVQQNRDKIKQIYKCISGDINQNSMMIYSGPYKKQNNYHVHHFMRHCHDFCFHTCFECYGYPCSCINPGCVYTGDADLKKSNISNIYRSYWSSVGTVQIPHHGSINSFSSDFFDGRGYVCPISYGKSNSHGHPSSYVVGEIIKNRCCPVSVTEDHSSILVQRIEKM